MGADIEDELREHGLRVTDGRVRVLQMLERHPHSDAATIHQALNESGYPTSVQSVHNVLGALADACVIGRIEPSGHAVRYERRAHDNHHHLVCTSCSAITDVDCAVGAAPCLHPSDPAGFTVASAEVTFWGLCAPCTAAARTSPADSA